MSKKLMLMILLMGMLFAVGCDDPAETSSTEDGDNTGCPDGLVSVNGQCVPPSDGDVVTDDDDDNDMTDDDDDDDTAKPDGDEDDATDDDDDTTDDDDDDDTTDDDDDTTDGDTDEQELDQDDDRDMGCHQCYENVDCPDDKFCEIATTPGGCNVCTRECTDRFDCPDNTMVCTARGECVNAEAEEEVEEDAPFVACPNGTLQECLDAGLVQHHCDTASTPYYCNSECDACTEQQYCSSDGYCFSKTGCSYNQADPTIGHDECVALLSTGYHCVDDDPDYCATDCPCTDPLKECDDYGFCQDTTKSGGSSGCTKHSDCAVENYCNQFTKKCAPGCRSDDECITEAPYCDNGVCVIR